jgi:hypothetical protein
MISLSLEDGIISASPSPKRLVLQLIRELYAHAAPEDDQMSYLRHIRDILIGLTDWTQVTDSPLSSEQKSVWTIYRQSLRDLPSNYSGEGPIPWPTIPI